MSNVLCPMCALTQATTSDLIFFSPPQTTSDLIASSPRRDGFPADKTMAKTSQISWASNHFGSPQSLIWTNKTVTHNQINAPICTGYGWAMAVLWIGCDWAMADLRLGYGRAMTWLWLGHGWATAGLWLVCS